MIQFYSWFAVCFFFDNSCLRKELNQFLLCDSAWDSGEIKIMSVHCNEFVLFTAVPFALLCNSSVRLCFIISLLLCHFSIVSISQSLWLSLLGIVS